MQQFIVTVKLPKNPDHDPCSKKIGPCPVSGKPCDDVTGEHHSFITNESNSFTVADVRRLFTVPGSPVIRVEKVV